ncbi:hypothetical protein [Pararhizobium arenae]|uniref:hypothetical protein n=1 Tax=Pararhizobium arenae TaxID=1856850 RepID=UPI00094AA4F7|nr:hypothetical protein [Pararhizobium arenae]
MLSIIRDNVRSPKAKAEDTLDRVRRALAAADTAASVMACGEDIPALIGDIELAREKFDDDIAAEAESIDRTRANALRSERSALSDLLTDAEYLQRRIEEKHRAMLKSETDAEMKSLAAAAAAKQAEAKALVIKLAGPLKQVVDAAAAYQALADEITDINAKLRNADRNELCVRPPLHSVTVRDENLGAAFGFLYSGRLTVPGVDGPNLLEIADRLKREAAQK